MSLAGGLLVMCLADLVGGAINALVTDNGFILPKPSKTTGGASIWQPEFLGTMLRSAFEDYGLAVDAHHPPPRWEGHGARLGDQAHRAVHWLPQSPARCRVCSRCFSSHPWGVGRGRELHECGSDLRCCVDLGLPRDGDMSACRGLMSLAVRFLTLFAQHLVRQRADLPGQAITTVVRNWVETMGEQVTLQ